MKHHDLKTWPEFFIHVESGAKTFEYRLNDRDFKTGDSVTLKEYNLTTKLYTGRELIFIIGYVLYFDKFGPQSRQTEKMCVFSLIPIEAAPPFERET